MFSSCYPMVIFSSGRRTFASFIFCVKVRANDKLPIRPQYINKITIIRENAFNSLVIPEDIPTVPMAENVSSSPSHPDSASSK